MSLSANRAQLEESTRQLMLQWARTREDWRDAKSLEFEQKHLLELQSGVDRALNTIDQLEKLLNRIRTDCE